MIIMLNELKNMDEGLKAFLCEMIFKKGIKSKNEIFSAAQDRYEDTKVEEALDIFLFNNLINMVQGIMHIPMKGDFLINHSRYHELKEKGYL